MPRVGDLVKPSRKVGIWRLGVVESIDGQGIYFVRLHVAPTGAYAGEILHCKADELVVVPAEKVAAALTTLRAEIASKTTLAEQVEGAIAAAAALVR